jgi:hypothetical protein
MTQEIRLSTIKFPLKMKAFIHLESEIASLIDKWFKLGILCCVMNHRQLGTCTIRDREFPMYILEV